MTTTEKNMRKAGRKPKSDPCKHRYTFNLNATDNARFLAQFEASAMKKKAHYITACVFDKPVKVLKIDMGTMEYYRRLTTFHAQFRAIGINYNQIVKALKNTFSEKKALQLLYKLEEETLKLVLICKEIIELTDDFEQKWLQK